ncbi:pyridine nucleotide-disulfide oxidoreductase [Frondihabitans sucicola]|uniref:Pyridine nucleotide-disulfide oxidoreductase n=1 Tax=Frondihabitans sucicola TaxID=1268041 RepID=A0ABM8GKE5_9MICO|nr:FAD-dependent oxidoreductase [Frondihabitans sucicola]BDZ48865.1 pyridine nucleotide-disulfide oxidoreductase [Frondihabitans sucicola]
MTGDPGLVVVGTGLAGVSAVQAARRDGYTGSITFVGAERHLPYNRPPLSKAFLEVDGVVDYLATEDELRNDLSVDLRLGCQVLSLDDDRKILRTSDGPIPYDRLIIATGASPRVLSHLPRMAGIETLRTVDDATRIRSAIVPGADVVIIGAGFIGSEIASSARKRGAKVTIVEASPVPLVRAVGEVVGAAISDLHRRNGTRLLCSAQIERVIGQDHVEGVRLVGGELIAADLVVVGVGAAPATGWLADSGLELSPVDGGLICDRYLRTSADGVYAAGDVAHWPNGLLDTTMRLENWTNAADQGAHAALNALFPDRAEPYETVPYFWSDWYGNRIQFVGTAIADAVSFVSGGPDEEAFVALFRRGDRLVGAATLNEPRKIMKLRRLIAQNELVASAVATF